MSNELKEYFIKKGGYYYRPDWCGYTELACKAGLYTKEEAKAAETLNGSYCVAVLAVDNINIGDLISIKNNINALLALENKDK